MSELRVDHEGPLAIVTLTRAAKLNALTFAILDGLAAAADAIEADDGCRVVLLTGEGSKAFCAGADIAEWGALGPLEFGRRWIVPGHRVFDRWARLRQPVIALLNGIAFGGGLELALCADIRIAAEGARLGLPEVTIAALPGWGGTQRLPRLIGPGRAKQMILTGQPIDAARAEAWGLVSEVVAADALAGRARELAAQIAANAPLAVQASKRLLDAAVPITPGATLETQAGALCGGAEDASEGRASFLERRPPRYQGR